MNPVFTGFLFLFAAGFKLQSGCSGTVKARWSGRCKQAPSRQTKKCEKPVYKTELIL